MTLKLKTNPCNGSVQQKQDRKKHVNVFFDCNVVVHHEFLPQGRTVNKEYYLEVMRRLRQAIHQKRTELWKMDFEP